MHWWQIAICLLFIANCLGNVRDAMCAKKQHQEEPLHWLIPNAAGWGIIFLALLPAPWGSISKSHWEIAVWSSILLLLYGTLMRATSSSYFLRFEGRVELPHLGCIDLEFLPLLLTAGSLVSMLIVAGEGIYRQSLTTDEKIIFVLLSFILLFGIRLTLRQYPVSRLTDLIALARIKPHPVEKPAQYDWIKPDKDETSF